MRFKICLYTLTPERDFALDAPPERALDGVVQANLAEFRADCAILTMAELPRSHVV